MSNQMLEVSGNEINTVYT